MNAKIIRISLYALLMALLGTSDAMAKEVRAKARSSVNVDRDVRSHRDRDIDIDIDRDIDIDVDVDYDRHGCCYHDHPVARAVAVTAAVATTAAIIGSIVHTVPPSCVAVIVNGITYQQCGSTWYQPQFMGTSVTYVVVTSPR